jgi:hypothetical protein
VGLEGGPRTTVFQWCLIGPPIEWGCPSVQFNSGAGRGGYFQWGSPGISLRRNAVGILPKKEKQTKRQLAPLYRTDGDVLPINGINPLLLGEGAANQKQCFPCTSLTHRRRVLIPGPMCWSADLCGDLLVTDQGVYRGVYASPQSTLGNHSLFVDRGSKDYAGRLLVECLE